MIPGTHYQLYDHYFFNWPRDLGIWLIRLAYMSIIYAGFLRGLNKIRFPVWVLYWGIWNKSDKDGIIKTCTFITDSVIKKNNACICQPVDIQSQI